MRFLHVPAECPAPSERGVYGTFHLGMVLSALRCLLTYIVLPILSPLLGAATNVGPAIGIPLALVALVFDVIGLRRFWLARHPWRWAMTAVYMSVMTLVLALLGVNVADLVS